MWKAGLHKEKKKQKNSKRENPAFIESQSNTHEEISPISRSMIHEWMACHSHISLAQIMPVRLYYEQKVALSGVAPLEYDRNWTNLLNTLILFSHNVWYIRVRLLHT